MKKIIYLSLTALIFTACKDDDNLPGVATPGKDVRFTTSVETTPGARTIYDDDATGDAWRINWIDGDEINIYSPQCMNGFQQAPYKVVNKNTDGASDNTLNYAKELALVNDAGVRWGDVAQADFYAVYPYTASQNQFYTTATSVGATIKSTVSANQISTAPLATNGTDGKNLFVKGDMKNNIMYAFIQNAKADETVNLRFIPAATVLQFKFAGLTTNSGAQEVTIQRITVTSPSGMPIAGDLNLSFGSTSITAAPSMTVTGTTSNTVALQTYPDNTAVTLEPGETMTANMFIAVPNNATYTLSDQWTITVETMQGTFSKTLEYASTNTGKTAELHPGQIHEVNLPAFQDLTEWTYQPGSWMEAIPSNVYISELSLPGAWYCSETDYQAVDDIGAQFDAGVRAFGLETRTASNRVTLFGNNIPNNIAVSGTGSNQNNAYVPQSVTQRITYVSTIINTLVSKLTASTNKREYAVLVLNYAVGGNGGYRDIDFAYWLQGLYDMYNGLSTTTKEAIYTDAITPNTTIGEVARKLIIKVNVDSRIPVSGTGTSPANYDYAYNNNLPALLSYTDLNWESGTSDNSSLISEMYWQNWSNSYRINLDNSVSSLNPLTMYWNYSSGNRTQVNTGTDATIPDYNNRQKALENLMSNSDIIYKASSHNVWFYFGAGGTQTTSATDTNTDAETFASVMNPWVLEQINSKIENSKPSPLGLVMLNQITSDTYKGPELINAIIEMNNKFYLQRDETQSVTPARVQSVSPDHASGFKADSESWNVF